MATLFDGLLQFARCLGTVHQGTADAQNATYIEDAELRANPETFTDGTVWILSGAHIGKTRLILTHSAGRIDFETLGSDPGACVYACFPGRFRRADMISALNAALASLEGFTQTDATLVTVSDQEEYTLPANVADLVMVEVARETVAPYHYVEHRHYRELGGKLRFNVNWEPKDAGFKMRLSFNAPHPILTADSTAIDAGVNLERIAWEAVAWLQRALAQDAKRIGRNDLTLQFMNEAKDLAAAASPHNLKRIAPAFPLSGW